MDRFRAAFCALAAFAAVTTVIASSGLLGSFSAAPSSYASVTGSQSSHATTNSTLAVTTAAPTASAATTATSTVASTVAASASSTTTTVTQTATVAAGGAAQGVVTTTVTQGAGGTTTVNGSAAGSAAFTAVQTTTVTGAGATTVTAAALVAPGATDLVREIQQTSLLLAPVSWVLLGGALIWRGRMRSRWTQLGFDSDVCGLFMRMKGGSTMIKLLNNLTTPKDRLQLAEEMGVDWKTVDRHVQILNKYGFVREQAAVGSARLYEVTPMGKMLLNLFDELQGEAVGQEKERRQMD